MNRKTKDPDKVLGCILGGAAGDALGYPVEFLSNDVIIKKYGERGICSYELNEKGVAEISDDTQMTLFTANGLLFWTTRSHCHGVSGNPEYYVRHAYLDWLRTQNPTPDYHQRLAWIFEDSRLHARRAPGNTCLDALELIWQGRAVMNNSKGCGGIMRVAPMALLGEFHFRPDRDFDACVSAANIAAITHKHPLGFITSSYLVLLLEFIQEIPLPDSESFCRLLQTVNDVFSRIPTGYDEHVHDPRPFHEDYDIIHKTYSETYPEHVDKVVSLVNLAVALSREDIPDIDAIRSLGEGWVAEETLAIALYSCIRHFGNFEDTIISAVNHDGDSDSTGSVAGQIMGLIVGAQCIPDKYKENLELLDLIEEIAADLAQGCPLSDYENLIKGLPRSSYMSWEYKYIDNRDYRPFDWHKRIAADKIGFLEPGQVFVFGSNLEGKHISGAAYAANHRFGAKWGIGVGFSGQSYAIPTMHGGVEDIRPYVDEFFVFAHKNPQYTFLVTKIGCGIAGFKPEDIAPLFIQAYWIENVHLPLDFWNVLERTTSD